MNTTVSYIEANAVCAVILAMILFNELRIRDRVDYRVLFGHYILTSIVYMGVDTLWVLVDRNIIPKTPINSGLISFLYLVVMGTAAYLWLLYSYAFTKSRRLRSPKSRRLAALPMASAALVTLSATLSGYPIYMDLDGTIHNPVLYFIITVPYLAYLVLASLQCMKRAREIRYGAERFQILIMALFPLFIMFTNLVQLFNLELPTYGYGTTIACLFIYMVFLQNMVSIDALTQTNNRNQIIQFMHSLENEAAQVPTLCMMMIDANDFKSINDTYGHANGDDALKAIAVGLKKTCGELNELRPFIARFGGDEFFVVLRTQDEKKVQEAAQAIHKAIDEARVGMKLPFQVSVSIGWAFLQPGESPSDCLTRADEALYREKQRIHG